jgi:hypothetical protein
VKSGVLYEFWPKNRFSLLQPIGLSNRPQTLPLVIVVTKQLIFMKAIYVCGFNRWSKKTVLDRFGHPVSHTYKLRTFPDFFWKCWKRNIVGGTELPVISAVASTHERLQAKFGDDRNIFEEFSSFSPKHWVWAVTYKTLKIFDHAMWILSLLESGENRFEWLLFHGLSFGPNRLKISFKMSCAERLGIFVKNGSHIYNVRLDLRIQPLLNIWSCWKTVDIRKL